MAYSYISPSLQPYFLPQPPPASSQTKSLHSDDNGFSLNANKVSPSILLIIIILAIIFFVSGLLHLLVRFLLRPPTRDPDDLDNVTALQGQLQQLFHLHDAGVDQSFIDTLPVFHYKAIIGIKNPFDCAVCLCEFEPEDKLRLLPKCSHAFHMECIDTWLLSHSTCPLCRASLLDFSSNNSSSNNNNCSPIVLVLESGSESSREIVTDRENGLLRGNSALRANSHLGSSGVNEFGSFGSSRFDFSRKSCEILGKDDHMDEKGEKIVHVKLGKFRSVEGSRNFTVGGECSSSSNNNIDERRCFSMGSFEYVMDENSLLQVPIRTPTKKMSNKKPSFLPLIPGHKPAMSEYDGESRRDFSGFDVFKLAEKSTSNTNTSGTSKGNAIGNNKKESFSISKIWLRGEKENSLGEDFQRRAFSSRFPVSRSGEDGGGGLKTKNEMGGDEENQRSDSGCSAHSMGKTPSFARRTLLWLAGRQNKVVHSSFTPTI